jgi:hypothetical protein
VVDVDGAVVLVVGLVLCFLGVGSVHLAVLASGFAGCWLIAGLFGAAPGTALVVALAGTFLTWLVVNLVFRAVALVLGLVVGAVVGARLYALLDGDDPSFVLALIVIAAVAAASAVLAHRYRERFLVWATALGGAGLAISGLARLVPTVDELRRPAEGAESVVATAVWVALALAGVLVQRQLFRERLGLEPATSG